MNKLFLITLLFVIPGIHCISEAKQTKRDIERLLPPIPPSFSHKDSVNLIRNWTVGIRFYKSSCSSCHGIFGKGKDSIPNFTKEQYDDYKSAYLAGDSTNHAVMSKMTQEELNDVFLFLTDIKR